MTLQVHTSHHSLTKSVTEVLRWKPESKTVVAIAAGESGREKGKNPTKFSETINLPYNDRLYRKYIYEKKICLLWTMSSVLSYLNTHTIKQSELK